MLTTLHQIVTGLIIALGVVHVIFTACAYDEFSIDAMWFAGSGMAIILAGFLNVVLLRVGGADGAVRALCALTNLILTILFAAAAFFILREPQAFVGVALFAIATAASFASKRTPSTSAQG